MLLPSSLLALTAGLMLGPTDAKPDAIAELHGPTGESHGVVHVYQHEDGLVLGAQIDGLDPGVHAIHIHETGACKPDFKAAGGHFNPTDEDHGVLDETGHHLGDLPNFVMPQDGPAEFAFVAERVRLEDGYRRLFDKDGAAIIIHKGRDDYRTDPAGDAGKRISCGVVRRADQVAQR
ncbi:MAG: superoxide dismutase family protein [Rhodothalassiaceae bacterium]